VTRRFGNSLALRMIAMTTAACASVFLIAGIVLGVWLWYAFYDEFDRALLGKAQAVAAVMAVSPEVGSAGKFPDALAGFGAGGRMDFYEVFDESGKVIARSPSLGNGDLPKSQFGNVGPVYGKAKFADGRHGRTVTLGLSHWQGQTSGRVALVVATATHAMSENLSETLWLVGWVFAIAGFLAVVVVGWAAIMGLRPVRQLADRIATTGEENLSDRFDAAMFPMEFRAITNRLNELLERIEKALGREKAFTADVAHELRTPIAGLETALEVCVSKPRDSEDYRRVVERCLATVRGMHALLDNLLLLARADARELSPKVRSVRLGELMRECWKVFEDRAAQKKLAVRWNVPDGLAGQVDAGLFSVVLNNVFDNALSYSDDGGFIEIAAQAAGALFEIAVRNSGCAILPTDAGKVFDRFWRGDAARSPAGNHAGLGLSLGQKIMALLNGAIEARVEPGNVFAVTIRGPAGKTEASEKILTRGPYEAV
jgi:two-component system, OmpR family, heavy metal sensor histidine kinase CusS